MLAGLLVAGIIVLAKGDGNHRDAEQLLLDADRSLGLRSASCKEAKVPGDEPDTPGKLFDCAVFTRAGVHGECTVELVSHRLEPGGLQDCMMDRLVTP